MLRELPTSDLPPARLGRGAVIWLTGLSGSGKSTLAQAAAQRLRRGDRACVVLDGDLLREGLCNDLGFSPKDRAENSRRVGEVAALFAAEGLVALCALISPDAAGRDQARAATARQLPAPPFFEVFVDAPLATCEARDVKGLYAKARAGELAMFTGVDAPYEAPQAPELHLRTDREDPRRCVEALLALLAPR
ncbi:MAG: adenylyl-sulfate kinase [Proteobacteria bacterium]|nr:MAG: adenylyl-sulfate kinase [Pseudomonadota bacterium]